MYVRTHLKIMGQWKSTLIDKFTLNPLSPKGDQHQISPCNINALQNRVVMRITHIITQEEFA